MANDSKETPGRQPTEATRAAAANRADLHALLNESILPRVSHVRDAAPHPATDKTKTDLKKPGTAEDSTSLSASVTSLAALLVEDNYQAATQMVEALVSRGHSAEHLCLHLLTPAAHRLGAGWIEDRLAFTDVTRGAGHLQNLLHRIWASVPRESRRPPRSQHKIILLPAEGEQHNFGLNMLAEFFRDAGWQVSGGPMYAQTELTHELNTTHVDCLGVTVSSERLLNAARLTIANARRNSANPDLVILAGGYPFLYKPELVATVGADATAADAPATVELATRLVEDAQHHALAL